MGSRVPPPVSPRPAPCFEFLQRGGHDDRWPVARCVDRAHRRPAGRGRRRAGRRGCAARALRVSAWMAAWDGVPLRQGSSSAALHIPGAASLANTASMVARASGLSQPLIGVMPSRSCLADGQAAAFGAVDVGEVAVGVEAVGELVGQLAQLVGAVLTGQPGQLRFGFGAGLDVDEIRAAGERSRGSPRHGRHRARPLRCAAAVAGSTGANGSPFNARRSPRSSASCTRREASAREIRNRSANAGASLPPSSLGLACSASWLIRACSMAGC